MHVHRSKDSFVQVLAIPGVAANLSLRSKQLVKDDLSRWQELAVADVPATARLAQAHGMLAASKEVPMSDLDAEAFRPRARPPGKDADPGELALFRRNPRDPDTVIRFARHVLDRDPHNVLARLMLASHEANPAERQRVLKEACDVGWGLWERYRKADGRAAWWDDKETRPFMTALVTYGVEFARNGDTEKAALAYRLLLKLDPRDRMGAEAAVGQAGVVVIPDAVPGRLM